MAQVAVRLRVSGPESQVPGCRRGARRGGARRAAAWREDAAPGSHLEAGGAAKAALV